MAVHGRSPEGSGEKGQKVPQGLYGLCPVCNRTNVRLYACRHCRIYVCWRCVFVKRCCGVVPLWHRKLTQERGKEG